MALRPIIANGLLFRGFTQKLVHQDRATNFQSPLFDSRIISGVDHYLVNVRIIHKYQHNRI